MSNGNNNLNIGTTQNYVNTLTKLPMSAMIGGPLTAAIDAQKMAAISTITFITEFCMEPSTSDNAGGKLKQLQFQYQLEKDSNKYETIKVPLLFLVPIPFIRIEHMSIGFTMNLTETHLDSNTQSRSNSNKSTFNVQGGGFGPGFHVSAGFSGSFSSSYKSSTHAENKYHNEMNFDVNVQAGQDDMPGGLKRVFDILLPKIGSTEEEVTDEPQRSHLNEEEQQQDAD